MLVYSGSISKFNYDIDTGSIERRIKEELERHGISHNNLAEERAWRYSLLFMKNVLSDNEIDEDTKIAIEYKIPTTSKRVDFLISGKDENDKSNLIVIELKQWESAYKTEKEHLVETFVGQANRIVAHPSYQAYSYAKTIENFSEYVQDERIRIAPCAYLHNYDEKYRYEIDNEQYKDIVNLAPLFLKEDTLKLRAFIKKYIKNQMMAKFFIKLITGRLDLQKHCKTL